MITIPPTDECGRVTLIGTVHVSSQSRDRVRDTIHTQDPDAVAIELDPDRFTRLVTDESTPLTRLVTSFLDHRNITQTALHGLLLYLQHRSTKDLDLKAGEGDMLPATRAAHSTDAALHLIDSESTDTFADIADTLSYETFHTHLTDQFADWTDLARFARNVVRARRLLTTPAADTESNRGHERLVERFESASLTEIEALVDIYKALLPPFVPLVEARDQQMAGRLEHLRHEYDSVVAVVGKAHVPGIRDYLEHPDRLATDVITNSPRVTFTAPP